MAVLASCVKEEAGGFQAKPNGKQVTIRVTMPENVATKASFSVPEGGVGLHLAWQEGDKIRVISGSNSAVYEIQPGFTDHVAEFAGPEVAGETFDIVVPGTFASVTEAEAGDANLTQNGNGSTDHLVFTAKLSGVAKADLPNIGFTDEWVSTHSGTTLKRGGIVKLVLTLPEALTAPSKVVLKGIGDDVAVNITNVDLTSEHVLTAYAQSGWDDVALAANTEFSVDVFDADLSRYSVTETITEEKTFKAGAQNILTVADGFTELLFVGGDGSQASPYLIANAKQLNNMHESGVLVSGAKKYFRLMKNIDASSITNWDPLNIAGTFDKEMDFDGAGYTIDKLTSSGKTYGSFAGVLYGHIHDVTFDHATITASSKCGVVAGFLGTTNNDYARVGTCANVTVSNSTVTNSSAAAGGFAGHVRGKGAVTECKVINTTVTGISTLGGFAGLADITGVDKYEVPAIFTSCEVDGVTLNQNLNAASSKVYSGGFIGETYQAHSFIDCKVKGTTITATKAAVQNVGGFVGYTGYAGANFVNCEVDSGTSISAKATNVGGFVGYATVPDAYTSCSTAATVNDEASAVGGFVGWACGSAAFKECSATGDVTGQRFVGGFAGVAQNASFTDCSYSSGTVTGNTTHTSAREGGFAGSVLTNVIFQGCYVSSATVSASGAGRVGGFVGNLGDSSNGGNNVTTKQCYVVNTSVSGAVNTGGFVGVQYETITGSYVSGGSVTANGNNCGGFSGFVQNGNISNCFTTANVVGGSYSPVGGFAGILYTTTISYCYSAGTVTGSGANKGAFVGQCTQQGTQDVADVSHCIGWDASLPFCASNMVGASISDVYAGNEGTVSSQATAQTWPTAIWNLEGSLPVLLAVPSRIPAIFIGDSITWQWASTDRSIAKSSLKIPINTAYMTESGDNVTVQFHPGFFSGNGYIDKGISGQNTTQMRARFQRDVVDQNPVVVVIMAGTNDLAQGVSKDDIVANISAMAELADGAGIKVVLCTVTPNNDTYSKLSNPKTKGAHIITLNNMLKDYADSKGFSWCDYWTSLVADDGLSLKEEYRLYDNLHPGPDGYDVMEPIINGIINGLL